MTHPGAVKAASRRSTCLNTRSSRMCCSTPARPRASAREATTSHCLQARRRPGATRISPTSASLRPASPPFKSDNLWNYEAGFKSSFADRRFTLNGAAFSIDWDKIQQAVHLPLCGYGYTGNAGRARSTGFELEFNGRPLPELTLGLGVGYTGAHLTEQGPGTPQRAGSPVYQVPDLTIA